MCLSEAPLVFTTLFEANTAHAFGKGPSWADCLIGLARGSSVEYVRQQVELHKVQLRNWNQLYERTRSGKLLQVIVHHRNVITGLELLLPAAKVYDF